MAKNRSYLPSLSPFQEKEALAIAEQELIDLASRDLLPFAAFTKVDFTINWHHILVAEAMDRFFKREIVNLMIFLPPRMGKTELVSRRFPASALGRDPNRRIIATSYSDSLASSANRDVQRIIDSEAYRMIFPNTTLSGENVRSNVKGSWLRNNDIFEIVGHRGFYRSAGIGSGITGFGFDFGLVDDPIKNWKEALSPTVRQTHWDWYTSTFYTRREKNAGICLIMTRWHEDDLAGRIIAQARQTGEKWTIVSLPMIKESDESTGYEEFLDQRLLKLDPRAEGEPLWPEKYSIKECESIRLSVGSKVWAGLYQQRPAPLDGSLVKREWFRFYRQLPQEAYLKGEWLQSWDLSFKNSADSDYVVGQVWCRIAGRKYLCDQVRARMGFTETIKAIQSLSAKWPNATVKLIEDKANGPAVIDSIGKEIGGVIAVDVKDSKMARLNACAPDFEAGDVLIPEPEQAPWVHDYMEELASFPSAANDDQVDGTTQALLRFKGQYAGDFSKNLVPQSNVTISGQRGKRW